MQIPKWAPTPSARRRGRPALALLALAVLIACAPANPGGGSTTGLSLTYPAPDTRLAGTVGLAASGIGGAATDLRFELGSASVDAAADGTAVLDTRSIPDGSYMLRATATVAGADVMDEIPVHVDNDLPASGVVGAAGGSLKTAEGSFATIPPGALPGSASVSVDDATQEGILADFGVDYPALGVTFLGAMEVDTGGVEVNLPVGVDLAGWAQAVQPGQQVVMFALAPDGDGDGVGELMFAAEAQATAGGSVITRPTPRSEVYGFGAAGGLAAAQASSVRPGTILTMTGRGFNPLSPLSNVARYGAGAVPVAETLVDVDVVESAAFNPLLEVRFAVPALGGGSQTVTLHNLTTGFRTAATSVGVLALGSGTAATWTGFREQVALAVDPLTADRADLASAADAWLGTLAAADPATFAAMATHSGLVSAGNRAALEQIAPGSLTASQADLVVRHALVLDAMAASTSGAAASAAADLAALLMVTSRAALGASASGVGASQSASPPCTGGATTPATGISWGAPVTTGMGSAPAGSCGAGGASGGGVGPNAADLSPAALATTSVRAGTFRPVENALVKVFRQGTTQALTPFTAISDPSGAFRIPFLAPGEPFTVRAVDLDTLQVAEASGVANGVNVTTPMQLVFGVATQGPGAPVADFVIRPVADPRFDGTVYYEFDASGSSDDGTIEAYVWTFGDFSRTVDWTPVVERGYGRNGTYEVRLAVIDDEGQVGVTTRQLVIDDLPYDYWGTPPERATIGSGGEVFEAEYGAAVSADGRYVAFSTAAGGLHPDDVNAESDVFLKDMETGAVALVSSGAVGAWAGDVILMSADARYVAYEAFTRSGSFTVDPRIEIVDRQAGSVETVTPEGNLTRIGLEALSADGRTVLFESSSLNGPRRADVKDLDTQAVTRIGLELDGVTYAADIHAIALSGDGDVVLFRSISGNLVPDDTNGQSDLFLHRRSDQSTVRVSVAADGTEGDFSSFALAASMTDDARYVTFWSEATTFPRGAENDEGFNRAEDVYVKDLDTGALTLVSTNALDASGDSDSVLPTISADGRYVAFGSYASNLAPEMDRYDGLCALQMCNLGFSYVKDLVTGRVAMVTVGLDDTVPDDWDQIEPTISADGRYVIFYSWASNLVEDDVPDTFDWFRAENPLWEP